MVKVGKAKGERGGNPSASRLSSTLSTKCNTQYITDVAFKSFVAPFTQYMLITAYLSPYPSPAPLYIHFLL